jgi:D-alanyl-D-alanine carboxypeptidase
MTAGRQRTRTPKRTLGRTGVTGLIAGAVAVTAFAAPAHAQARTGERAGGGHAATQRAMDALVAKTGIPGVAGQASGRDGVWKGASGTGDLRTGKKRGADDRFRVASITKTFVATALLLQEAEGRLSLDDTVEKWLPGLVRGNGNDGSRITVRQLLNHSSGIAEYGADPAYAEKYMDERTFMKNRFLTRTPQEAVEAAMRLKPWFEPGARHQYSNTNYVLAGMILEKAGGSTYENEIRRLIVKPLKLRDTVLPGDTSRMPGPSSRAYSKLFSQSPTAKVRDVTHQNGSQSWADGDIISTAGDLNRFLKALVGGRLLPPKQLKAMQTTLPSDNTVSGTDYGLGLVTYKLSCGTRVWGHLGGMHGSLSSAFATEDGRHALSFNLNGDWRADQEAMTAVSEAEFCGREPVQATTSGP